MGRRGGGKELGEGARAAGVPCSNGEQPVRMDGGAPSKPPHDTALAHAHQRRSCGRGLPDGAHRAAPHLRSGSRRRAARPKSRPRCCPCRPPPQSPPTARCRPPATAPTCTAGQASERGGNGCERLICCRADRHEGGSKGCERLAAGRHHRAVQLAGRRTQAARRPQHPPAAAASGVRHSHSGRAAGTPSDPPPQCQQSLQTGDRTVALRRMR